MKFGLDVFIADKNAWRGKRVGLIVHQASVTRDLTPAVDAWRQAGAHVAALFAPEHGLAGTLQDQVTVVAAGKSPIPIHSLYGKRLAPTPEMLSRLDALVFDLQDIGVRYYTFIWTMALSLEAAARAGKPFIVLDRPNPLGGGVEGNIPDPRFASFVGLYPLPVRHGLTAGELALYLNETQGWGADLRVVRMRGWRRQWHDQTDFPWIMPSPNMPTLDTAIVYGGMCLLEATNISEGRGTTRPFEILGAPYINAERLAAALTRQKLPGAAFRPASFLPTFNKWQGRTCHGVQLHVTNRRIFPSYLTGLTTIQTVRRLWPGHFAWKKPPYEYETKKLPMDILCGTDRVRIALERGQNLKTLARGWRKDLQAFEARTRKFKIY